MKIHELPEDFKQYEMTMSNGSAHIVSGTTKQSIIKSHINFVELYTGTTVNKAFIVEFKLDNQMTKVFYNNNKDKLVKIKNGKR